MNRKEEIEKASKEFARNKEYYFVFDVQDAFENGAKWADKHPDLSSLWHDVSEEPKEYPIIYQDELSDVWIMQFNLKNIVDGWEDFKGFECVTRWAYVKDLLPKGGAKK